MSREGGVAAGVALLGEFRIPLQASREACGGDLEETCVSGAAWINWGTYGA